MCAGEEEGNRMGKLGQGEGVGRGGERDRRS